MSEAISLLPRSFLLLHRIPKRKDWCRRVASDVSCIQKGKANGSHTTSIGFVMKDYSSVLFTFTEQVSSTEGGEQGDAAAHGGEGLGLVEV